MSELYIAYCEENKSVASEITQKLSKGKIKFTPLSSNHSQNEKGLTFLIAEAKSPGILLLSDNFLKDETCMQNMLNFIQNSSVSEQMQVVVIDGQYASGNIETSFDRVSSVIKYMNFWQERYLELRKQKRTIDASKEDTFNESLQNVKNISSEIGDFLRVIRNKDFWTHDQLVFNNFEIFFKKFSSISQHQAFVKIAGDKKTSPILNVKADSPAEETATKLSYQNPSPAKTIKETASTAPTLVEESVMTLNDKISKANISQPVVKTEVNSISNTPAKTLNEKIAAQLKDKKNVGKEFEKEEKEIEEVLQEVNFTNTSEIITSLPENNFSAKENISPALDNSVQDDLEKVFNQENLEDDLEIEDVIIEDEPVIESKPTVEEELVKKEDEEDFDVMDGLEIDDDITDEMDEFIEEDIDHNDSYEDIYEEEIEEIEEVPIDHLEIHKSKQDLSAAMNAANAYMMSGAHREGIKAFENLLEDYPDNVDIRYRFAHNLREEVSDHEKAVIHFEKIIKTDPNHYPSYKALAEISEQNNDFLLAKSYYEKVVNLHPEEQGVYYKLGLITAGFYAEKPKLAAKYFKKAILQNPSNDDAYYRYGLLLNEHLHKNKKALNNFHKTLEINPKHSFANYDLALLYHKIGDLKNAAIYYENAWNINPELKTPENDIAFKYEESSEKEVISKTEIDSKYSIPIDNDKVILITGATSGIGQATATLFAKHGFRIIITGRRSDRLDELKKDFETNYNTKVKTLTFDVRNLEEVKSMVNDLDEEWKNVDVLINNAGLAKGYAPIHEGNIDHWDTMIDTNIKGLLYLTRAIAPHMVQRKSGHIVNVCSTAGKETYPNGNVYCATKHAVDALTKAMRLDLYKHNIRVGQVSPAHVEETEFAYVRFEDKEKAKIYNDFQPLRSADVADAIFYIINTPPHVNVQDILLMGKQQANSSNIDRSGR